MSGPRILVVDDEPQILRALQTNLRGAGYTVETAATGAEALGLAAAHPPDAFILDLVLPDTSGTEVARELRGWTTAPIIVLSVVGDEQEKVAALDAGADDYVTKPFGMSELLARLRAAVRRVPATPEPVIEVGELRVDLAARTVSLAGKPVQLTPNEFDMLRLLAQNRWPFRLHATYDESISRFLDVFEAVNKEIPFDGLRWFFDHAETVTVRNLERIKALNGGIAIQHRMAYQGEYFIDRYGASAAHETPPVKKMLEMGIPVGAGTDATRVASYNPWVSLYWLVAGKTVGGMILR